MFKLYKDDTIWLTQKLMSELFEVDRSVINKHLKNIYESGELVESSTCVKIAQVQTEGNRQVKRNIDFFNLDAIISAAMIFFLTTARFLIKELWEKRTANTRSSIKHRRLFPTLTLR